MMCVQRSLVAAWLFALPIVGMLLLSLARADDAADKTKEDKKKLQGTWKVLSIEQNEEKSDKSGDDVKMIFAQDDFTAKTPNTDHKGTFKIDAAAKPKTIDIAVTEGPEKDKTVVGIYEFKGDELKICLAKPGEKDRPKEFAAKRDSGMMVLTLKRE